MKEAIIEILQAGYEDGKVPRRDVASFVLLLAALLIAIAGLVAGTEVVMQITTLAAVLALVVSMRLVVKPTGGIRGVYLAGAALSALTMAAGFVPSLNDGRIAVEPACAALLITSGALFAARLKASPTAETPAPSAG